MEELTQEQIDEVCRFQISLNKQDEWLFYHMAWVAGDTEGITFEDRYEVMKNWENYISDR